MVPLIFEALLIAVLGVLLLQTENEIHKQARLINIIAQAELLSRKFSDANESLCAYSITRNPIFEDRYKKTAAEVYDMVQVFTKFGREEPGDAERVKRLIDATYSGLSMLKEAKAAIAGNKNDDWQFRPRTIFVQIRSISTALEAQAARFIDEQTDSVQHFLVMQKRAREQAKILLGIGLMANLFIALMLASFFSKAVPKRFEILRENALRLARGAPLHPRIAGADEIAELDAEFHGMAESLNEASEHERALVENVTEVICAVNDKGSVVRINPAVVRAWSYEPEDLLGRKLISIIPKEDHEVALEAMAKLRVAPVEVKFETRLCRGDGAVIDLVWGAYTKRPGTAYLIAHDITERKREEDLLKEAKAKMRLILESMPVGIIVVDADGTIELVNSTAAEMFETGNWAIANQPFTDLFTDFSEGLAAADVITELRVSRNKLLTAKRATGSTFPVEVLLREFQGPQGDRLLAVLQDVTEKQEVERLKQELIAIVSHELRTPLTSIRGFLTMLEEGLYGELNDDGTRKTCIAERNVEHLIKLVNDLLSVEKLESGSMQMTMRLTHVSLVCQRSLEAVQQFADRQQVPIEVQDRSADAALLIDPDRITQVLINLLSNAIKYSPPGQPITLGIDMSRDWLEVRVTDLGRGIPQNEQKRIFGRFQQVRHEDGRELGGSGLGLAICKAIVEQHGGLIGVDSQENKGSSFWFRLPNLK